jgi:TusA-related sulfurtransferase
MQKAIDARGLSCPQPVLMTIQAMQQGENEISVIVDNEASFENVSRAATAKGYTLVKVDQTHGEYHLSLSKKQ